MTAFLPRLAHRLFGSIAHPDGAPIGGPDPVVMEALAVSTPVLSLLAPGLATYSPDQAHELGYALGRAG